ncbi:hypothetical protein QEH59_04225 [Coraliomargarita sp. SDUM461004]|uniref:PEP-CTERM protein-sorting domain-containing protein n=1 Tax=Thalassobacterium sedimentorum TaxID=3041258 RepID=A0ABU1AFL4_9BACT|nr:hypothetical protein [Coraliomargarita sp. SDUM461004]MDQ8193616.1 hypothetical protein [Coraliomargarita sp. SDUM461004]
MKKVKYTSMLCCLLQAGLVLPLAAQVNFEGEYSQNFDSLPLYESNSGTDTFNFISDSTIAGWYSSEEDTDGNEGRSSGGAASASGIIFNWGRTSDRALGNFSSDGFAGTVYLGVLLQNNSGATINTLGIEYVLEQWRRNTSATTWTLEYMVTSDTSNAIGAATGFTTVSGSSVTSSTGSAAGVNGDWSGNEYPVDLTISGIDWDEGEYLWLRWADVQGATSSGFGLDDLSVSSIPEPASSSFLFGIALLFLMVPRSAQNLRRRR